MAIKFEAKIGDRKDVKAYAEKIKALPNFIPEKQRHDRPGRPPSGKKRLTLLVDPEVIEAFRATGAGWQSRMNDALRKAAGL